MKTYIESKTYKLTKTELDNGHVLYRLVNRETGEVEREYSESIFDSWVAVTVHCGNHFFAAETLKNMAKKMAKGNTPYAKLYNFYKFNMDCPYFTPEKRKKNAEKFEWLTELAVLEN